MVSIDPKNSDIVYVAAYGPLWSAGGERGIYNCLLYTSDAADERSSVDLGGRRIIKKKTSKQNHRQETATDKKKPRTMKHI